MERISDSVYGLLMRQGMRARTAATGQAHGMKNRESAGKRSTPEFTAEGRGVAAREHGGGVLMLISNGARVVECAPWLMIIDGGRK